MSARSTGESRLAATRSGVRWVAPRAPLRVAAKRSHHTAAVVCLVVFTSLAPADPRPRIDPAGIKGEILLSAADVPALALTRFVERAGGDKAKILVLVAGKETLSPRLRKAADGAKVEVRPVTATDDGSVPDFADIGGVWNSRG